MPKNQTTGHAFKIVTVYIWGLILDFHLKETCISIFAVPSAKDSVAVSCIWLNTVKLSVNFTRMSRFTEKLQAGGDAALCSWGKSPL